MRIRKHAKLAGLSSTTTTTGGSADLTAYRSSRFHSPHICQLNQSPWDVLSFPPDSASSPFQLRESSMQIDGDDSFTANGSSGNSLGAIESVASMRISVNLEDKNVNSYYDNGVELGLGNGGTIVCCTTVGKDWQCKKEASRGHSLCEHQLGQSRLCNSSLARPSAAATNKTEKPPAAAAIRRRGRPKKAEAPSAAVENPYEFYYYSGFGPRWGKRRGGSHETKSGVKVEEEVSTVKGTIKHSSSSSSSHIDSEGFDYVEDEEDEEDNVSVKKRGRKPIKARSLKSLM